jgi:hypothetical protein
MRVTPLATLALISALSVSVLAQEDWMDFRSDQDKFTCDFPGTPKITNITYSTHSGLQLPGHVYTSDLGPAHKFVITVVDYHNITQVGLAKQKTCPPGAETCAGGNGQPGNSTGPGYSKADRQSAMVDAAWALMQGPNVAKTLYLGWTNIALVEGYQVRLQNKDGSLTAASVFMHEDRLYITEGTVPKGYPEPGLFYQSLAWLDADGNNVRYADFYHTGFPKPPAMGRGGAAGPAGAQPQGQGAGGRGRQ